jgi:hypothetical protein
MRTIKLRACLLAYISGTNGTRNKLIMGAIREE